MQDAVSEVRSIPNGTKPGDLVVPLVIYRLQPLIVPVIVSVPAVALRSPLIPEHAATTPVHDPLSAMVAVNPPVVICSASVVLANALLLRPTSNIIPNSALFIFFHLPFPLKATSAPASAVIFEA